MTNNKKQTAVDKAADDYFKLSHSRLKNEQQKEYERELFIAGANCMIRIINKTQTEMTNETKQTALDRLLELLRYLGYLGIDYSPQLIQAIEQAKEMEKEQIEEAYWEGGQKVPISGRQCTQYYNETYGGNNGRSS
jgi:hypothetical protein